MLTEAVLMWWRDWSCGSYTLLFSESGNTKKLWLTCQMSKKGLSMKETPNQRIKKKNASEKSSISFRFTLDILWIIHTRVISWEQASGTFGFCQAIYSLSIFKSHQGVRIVESRSWSNMVLMFLIHPTMRREYLVTWRILIWRYGHLEGWKLAE